MDNTASRPPLKTFFVSLMATAYFCFSPLPFPSVSIHSSQIYQTTAASLIKHHNLSALASTQRSISTMTLAMGSDMLGDFGARDPFPAEIESKFGEKVLGNVDTEHKILIPTASALSLAQRECMPVSPLLPPMPEEEAKKLLKKVVGWRLLNEEGRYKVQCLWKLRDFKCGLELINRILEVVEVTGHFPDLHLEQPNQVRAELWTASIGGLSLNDFIVAAKIDEIKTSDLVPKKRIWA